VLVVEWERTFEGAGGFGDSETPDEGGCAEKEGVSHMNESDIVMDHCLGHDPSFGNQGACGASEGRCCQVIITRMTCVDT